MAPTCPPFPITLASKTKVLWFLDIITPQSPTISKLNNHPTHTYMTPKATDRYFQNKFQV